MPAGEISGARQVRQVREPSPPPRREPPPPPPRENPPPQRQTQNPAPRRVVDIFA